MTAISWHRDVINHYGHWSQRETDGGNQTIYIHLEQFHFIENVKS